MIPQNINGLQGKLKFSVLCTLIQTNCSKVWVGLRLFPGTLSTDIKMLAQEIQAKPSMFWHQKNSLDHPQKAICLLKWKIYTDEIMPTQTHLQKEKKIQGNKEKKKKNDEDVFEKKKRVCVYIYMCV